MFHSIFCSCKILDFNIIFLFLLSLIYKILFAYIVFSWYNICLHVSSIFFNFKYNLLLWLKNCFIYLFSVYFIYLIFLSFFIDVQEQFRLGEIRRWKNANTSEKSNYMCQPHWLLCVIWFMQQNDIENCINMY